MISRMPVNRRNSIALGAVALLLACAHEPAPPTAQPKAPPNPEPAESAGSREPGAPAEAMEEWGDTAAELEPHPPARIEDYMDGHFVIATWSRDSVIRGDIDALREPLLTLAEFDYGPVAPGSWMPQIAALQQTARFTASAQTLEAAAIGVSTMARQCGDCHSAERHKPYYGPDIRSSRPRPPGSLRERMERHIWGADRMWEGLTAPSEDAWHAGAAALAQLPPPTPSTATGIRAEFEGPLRQLGQLAQDALAADTSAERADAYARLLTVCANCHAHEEVLR